MGGKYYNARRNRNFIRARQRKAHLRDRELTGIIATGVPSGRRMKPMPPKWWSSLEKNEEEQAPDTKA